MGDLVDTDSLKAYFLNSDSTKNLFLSSNVPDICKTEPCRLGVDEAGRGPVLGPMVYGICYCPINREASLKGLGCADSKALTENKREAIFAKICSETDYAGWAVEVIAANTICNCMLRRQKYSLNQVSHDATIGLIKQALTRGVNVKEVYVDTVGIAEKYQAKLSEIFPQLKITVESKADAKYPVVGGASICAKVCRDVALRVWETDMEIEVVGNWGSGYPNDPVTKKFLTQNIDHVFGFPSLVRFSWSTAEKILQEHAATVEWEEEEEPAQKSIRQISSFFKQTASSAKLRKKRHPYFSDRKLNIAESL